jgi:DNA mismatch repair protein PMS2
MVESLRASSEMGHLFWVSPRNLNLAAPDELLAAEHLDMLQLNGFELSIDEDAPVGQRVKLVALPVSKDTQFGLPGE